MPDDSTPADLGALRAAAKPPLFFYDSTKKEFLARNARGRWLAHSQSAFCQFLICDGIAKDAAEAVKVAHHTVNNADVQYVGSLAGRQPGYHQENGVRMLVTEGPVIITPKPGAHPLLSALIEGLLGQDTLYGERQMLAFLWWLKSGVESVRAGIYRPAHILALAGPVACGKSLLQQLITVALGGRSADAFLYLSGATTFNRELFASEHLTIDDKQGSSDFRVRMQMAAHLKGIAVAPFQCCHGKNREAVNLKPIWRCSISLNNEGECLLVLPPIRADIADKIHLLKCAYPPTPFPTGNMAEMEAYWAALVAELPAFIAMLDTVAVPDEYADRRFGHRCFQHPDILIELDAQCPELVLADLINVELWRDETILEWEGTALELEVLLTAQNSTVREQVKRLLSFNNAMGTFLGRLEKKDPEKFAQNRSNKTRYWRIRKLTHADKINSSGT